MKNPYFEPHNELRPPKQVVLALKYTVSLHFWALFYPNPTRNALFKPFSINFKKNLNLNLVVVNTFF